MAGDQIQEFEMRLARARLIAQIVVAQADAFAQSGLNDVQAARRIGVPVKRFRSMMLRPRTIRGVALVFAACGCKPTIRMEPSP